MKFALNKNDLEKVYHLFEVKEINIALAEMLMYFFQTTKPMSEAKNEKEYLANFCDVVEIDPQNPENTEIIAKQIKPTLKCLKEEMVTQDPYFLHIHFPEINEDGYEYTHETYFPYQGFPYDEISVLPEDFREVQKIGYFKSQVDYPILTYQKRAWMSVSPNEIETFQEPFQKMHGKTITFGLGMGYFVYIACLKEEVESITVVERDEHIIALFKKHLLPQFPHPEKVIIIQEDAYEFIKREQHYDYAYVDLWHNPIDGLPFYLAFKNAEKNFPHCQFDYWLEVSILALYRRCLLTVALEQLNELAEKEYLKANNPMDKIINEIYFKTKKITIKSYEQFHDLCLDKNLIKLIKQ